MKKLSFSPESRERHKEYATVETLRNLQLVVYTMVGGGMLGRMASEQPKDFYIDGRVGKLPYKKAEIHQAVEVLIEEAEILGMDARNLPRMGMFHACGIF